MEDKEKIAIKALDYVKNNTVIGLGTGSTANYFIKHLAHKIQTENLNIHVVASSTASEIQAKNNKLVLLGMDALEGLNLYVDGADEITNSLEILKGRGYDLVKEKILAQAADEFIVVADDSKKVDSIGDKYSIPIEVSMATWRLSKKMLDQFGSGELRLNSKQDAYAISSAGNYILDYQFKDKDIKKTHDQILTTPGVIETGIFLNIASKALIIKDHEIEIIT